MLLALFVFLVNRAYIWCRINNAVISICRSSINESDNRMKKQKIGRHVIELYDSIEEVPVNRFFTYNRMLLIDSGIGVDMGSVDEHLGMIMRFIEAGNKEKAMQEVLNMRTNIYFVTENLNPKHMSYAALVYSVDGKLVTDFSDENLRRMLTMFSEWGMKKGFIQKAIEAVKKNSKKN